MASSYNEADAMIGKALAGRVTQAFPPGPTLSFSFYGSKGTITDQLELLEASLKKAIELIQREFGNQTSAELRTFSESSTTPSSSTHFSVTA